MIIHNIEQKTQEWLNLRKGKMTASHAQAIGNVWKWLDTYIYEMMSEFFSSGENEWYTNKDIERWNELEPLAREMYELETGRTVQEVWFIEFNEYIGCSPDWLVWEDWGIEIKCVKDIWHFKLLVNWPSEIDSWYIWQIQMSLFITGRKWWDYVSYNPNYKQSLIIHRIYPDDWKFDKLREWFKYWINKIEEIKQRLSPKL